jgi:hypothetical protein
MLTIFLDERIDYDGGQLASHWIFDRTGKTGDAAIAFIGACSVAGEHMVDLVDKRAACRIFSEEMLHFIVEHFDNDLERAVLRQRLFVAMICEELRRLKPAVPFARRGNDIYDGDAKVNVSIATASPVSTLMHIGVNISSRNTPVKARGLADWGLDAKTFAEEVMRRYNAEVEGMKEARTKVRWVK